MATSTRWCRRTRRTRAAACWRTSARSSACRTVRRRASWCRWSAATAAVRSARAGTSSRGLRWLTMHLTVTDFQSLGRVEVEVSGLTVLVGPSNRGKSALIRALEAVLFNKPGDAFVRHGKKKAVVELLDVPTADG